MARQMKVIVATFDAATQAEEVEEKLQQWDREFEQVKLGNIAVIQKNAAGQVSFRETHDIRSEIAGVVGTVTGSVAWVVYAIAGSLGSVAGPLVGYETTSAVERLLGDMGFPDDALQQIGEELQHGSSALVLLVSPDEEALVVKELQQLGGTLMQHLVPDELAARLTS